MNRAITLICVAVTAVVGILSWMAQDQEPAAWLIGVLFIAHWVVSFVIAGMGREATSAPAA